MEIIIPLKEKSSSNYQMVNFLYYFPEINLYLTDNHRIAFWNWINNIAKEEFGKYTLIHLDDHFDARANAIDDIEKIKSEIKKLKNLTHFLSAKQTDRNDIALIGWDNFIDAAIKLGIFKNIIFFVPQEINDLYREIGKEREFLHYQSMKNIDSFDYYLKEEKNVVLSMDLDYFVYRHNDTYKLLCDEYINYHFENIKNNLDNIKLVTIALSPECCGGWENTEKILKLFIGKLNLSLQMPLETNRV